MVRPFSLTPDPKFYFRSRSHSRVFDTLSAALVGSALLSPEDLLRLMLQDLGAISKEDVKEGRIAAAGRVELVEMFDRFLVQLGASGDGAVMIVDETHSLPPATRDQVIEIAFARSASGGMARGSWQFTVRSSQLN